MVLMVLEWVSEIVVYTTILLRNSLTRTLINIKTTRMIAHIFVAFSEKLNFNKATRSKLQTNWVIFFKFWTTKALLWLHLNLESLFKKLRKLKMAKLAFKSTNKDSHVQGCEHSTRNHKISSTAVAKWQTTSEWKKRGKNTTYMKCNFLVEYEWFLNSILAE